MEACAETFVGLETCTGAGAFFCNPTIICRTQRCLTRGPRTFKLCVSEPHWRMSISTDRKSTRLNSSHANISYAVFCLKKKKKEEVDDIVLLEHVDTLAKSKQLKLMAIEYTA